MTRLAGLKGVGRLSGPRRRRSFPRRDRATTSAPTAQHPTTEFQKRLYPGKYRHLIQANKEKQT